MANLLQEVRKWRSICIYNLVINFAAVIANIVVDAQYAIPGRPLPYILAIEGLLIVTDLFGAWNLIVRIKTSMLIFTICQISFGIIVACIEIISEVRYYVVAQHELIPLELVPAVDAGIYNGFFFQKYLRIVNAVLCLISGASFYIYR